MKNWLLAIVISSTFIASGQTTAKNTKNRFYISDETNNKTTATASVNGIITGSVNKEGWIEFTGLKLNDRVRIYKPGYDTLFYLVWSELDLGNTLYGQLYPTTYGFKNIAPWDDQQTVKPDPIIPEPSTYIPDIDEPATFPGGRAALNKYLMENLVYPESAKAKEIEGKVYARFIVLEDGTISSPSIQKNLPECPECDEEVLKLVGNMPKWIPAKSGGKPVKSYQSFPVSFRLQ